MYHVMCHVTCQVTDHVMKHSTKHIQGTEEQDNKDVKLSLQLATPSVYELPATQAQCLGYLSATPPLGLSTFNLGPVDHPATPLAHGLPATWAQCLGYFLAMLPLG